MSSDRTNSKRFENQNINYKIKELIIQSKKGFRLKNQLKGNSHNQLNKEIIKDLDDNFDIIKSLHLLLLNCSTLTKKQKFDYCNSQRYFMKLYLKEIIRKI